MYIIIFRKKVFFTHPTENALLHGPVRPALLRYALPIILSMVATQFYSVADTMIIGLRLDADAMTISLDGTDIPVTTREFNILFKLLSYPNHTFSRSQLMDEFWGLKSDTRLRDKFSQCNQFQIKTIRGLGYKAVIL